MKKVLAFGASNSQNSINRQLVTYAASCLKNVEVEILDLNDYEMPIYSIDREQETGIHPLAHQFKGKIKESDALMISFAEHNGSYTAAYKNIYDWISRIERNVWLDRPIFVMATSPGGRGGKGVLTTVLNQFKHSKVNLVSDFSLPHFSQNFNKGGGISDTELQKRFDLELEKFQHHLDSI